MKCFLLTAALAACFFLPTRAQTTQTEYDYITKGYRAQVLEQGGDLKSGYRLVDLGEAGTRQGEGRDTTSVLRQAWLKGFYKTVGASSKLVAYMLVYQRGGGPKEYLCIPSPLSDAGVLQQYLNALYNGQGDSSYRLQAIAQLLSQHLSWK